jgi:hypothetical protein
MLSIFLSTLLEINYHFSLNDSVILFIHKTFYTLPNILYAKHSTHYPVFYMHKSTFCGQ